MLWVEGSFEERFGAGAEQQVIDDLLVLHGKRGQFPWNSENNMYVGSGEQLALARLQPAVAGIALTFWAMTIAARVVRDSGMPAGARIDMAAQGNCAAACDGQQYFLVLPSHPLATALEKSWARSANQVGHL